MVRMLDASTARRLGDRVDADGPAPGDPRTGLFNDSWTTDRSFTRTRSAEFAAAFAPAVANLFVDHHPLIWGTSVKWPGAEGEVGPHRDPTFVDEHRFRSVGVFCALHDLDIGRGTLEVLPRSHRPDLGVRVHQSEHNLIRTLRPDDERRFVVVPLDAGEAIVYDHSLVHRSAVLDGDRPRVVAMTCLVPASADVRYAVRIGDGKAAVLEVDADFFLDHRMNVLDVDAILRSHRTSSTVQERPGFGTI